MSSSQITHEWFKDQKLINTNFMKTDEFVITSYARSFKFHTPKSMYKVFMHEPRDDSQGLIVLDLNPQHMYQWAIRKFGIINYCIIWNRYLLALNYRSGLLKKRTVTCRMKSHRNKFRLSQNAL